MSKSPPCSAMSNSEFLRIKQKMIRADPDRYWGDDFDVRFYVASRVRNLQHKKVLDVGGGIGIISSVMNESNLRINLDLSFEDLGTCKRKIDDKIKNICASMTHLPFKNDFFDYVICCHILEVAKWLDIENNTVQSNGINEYPTVTRILREISRVLNFSGIIFLTTPNNAYYQTVKLSFEEIKKAILLIFPDAKIFFYNTYPKLSKKIRKLNLANVIPKLKSKITKKESIFQSLLRAKSQKNYSVSFFIEARKQVRI